MLQITARKILYEAETAFEAMTQIENYAQEHNLPPPIRPIDYARTLLDMTSHFVPDRSHSPEESIEVEALIDLSLELIPLVIE